MLLHNGIRGDSSETCVLECLLMLPALGMMVTRQSRPTKPGNSKADKGSALQEQQPKPALMLGLSTCRLEVGAAGEQQFIPLTVESPFLKKKSLRLTSALKNQ